MCRNSPVDGFDYPSGRPGVVGFEDEPFVVMTYWTTTKKHTVTGAFDSTQRADGVGVSTSPVLVS